MSAAHRGEHLLHWSIWLMWSRGDEIRDDELNMQTAELIR